VPSVAFSGRAGVFAIFSAHGSRQDGWQMGVISVKVDPSGRVVIPKDLRDALGIPQGGELRLSIVDGELRGLTRVAALRQVQAKYASRPAAGSAVDDVIAWRRAEARDDRAP
jgi:AbrB family looped-hinge helix DNA binding protein